VSVVSPKRVPPAGLCAAIRLVAALLLCGAAAAADPPPERTTTPPDTSEIQSLPGYRTSRVPTTTFPGETYVLEAGPSDARPVILIHGIARDGAHDWDSLVPVLARSRRVLTFDLPGFGRSSRSPDASYDPGTYADLVDELIAQRVSGDFDVVAHSMGVSIGLEVASRHAGRVGRLVLADAAALLHGQALSLEQIERSQENLGTLGRLLDPLRHSAYDLLGRLPESLVHALAIGLADDTAENVAARLVAHDSGPALDAIRAPTLVVWGTRDDIASPRGAWVLASRLRDARLAWLVGVGHVPMRERPDEFDGLVTRWLAGETDVGEALAPAVVPSTRSGRCQRSGSRTVFRGAYDRLEIESCGNVVLENVRARSIEIFDSDVTGEDVVAVGDAIAMQVRKSRVRLSGGRLVAKMPLRVSGSELDLAGITFEGESSSVQATGNAKLLCSLCRAVHADSDERIHGFRALYPG